MPVVTVVWVKETSNHLNVGSFKFIPNITTANMNFWGLSWTTVEDGYGALSTLNEADIISLFTVLIPRLVKRTAKIISTAIENNPPVAVLNSDYPLYLKKEE